MANSRRRERELARRRYERRRLREMEQRARRRRRNTIAGAGVGTAIVIGLLVFLAVHLSGGSSDQLSPSAKAGASSSATPTPSVTPVAAPKKCAPIKPNPPAKGQPTVPPVAGKAPTKLVVKDVKRGHGPAAKRGATLSVTYIGISCSTGKVFDASYLHGNQPFQVTPLGRASVIAGWNQGLLGVRTGGVRELVIPAKLGYGAAGSPPSIKPNETLIFLITVKSVQA
ncbi:MAG TPA: FKBP-type peptidyl-prolyl cis-trans isomerase [Mycobacteriales bacterium]|nr:FKBP-type peptidyl-prolyl cis-trans isomerase [Mycobacteriales bacterium]